MENIKPPVMIFLIGLPGSGKSTWLNTKLENKTDYVILSTDDILEEYIAKFNINYNTAVREHYKAAESRMKSNFRTAVKNLDNIILDRTNMAINVRRKFLSQLPKAYHKIAIIFNVDDVELYKRLEDRAVKTGKRIAPSIIENMKSYYTPPSLSEGFDELIQA